MITVTEKPAAKINGFLALFLLFLGIILSAYLIYEIASNQHVYLLWILIPMLLIMSVSMNGFIVVQPNDSRVLVVFGRYTGSVRDSGFWFINPFSVKRNVTLRIRNFNSEKIKVNDLHGNPIEIAAVVVWQVTDSARAVFDVDNYETFVDVQSETAIRSLASQYPYDGEEDTATLRGSPQEIAENLKHQVQMRLDVAGVSVLEARISHLAYAPEIAQAMLRRQQAQAIVAARQKIVEGAVGMVQSALHELCEQKIVELDEEKKATMVNNLLVALVSEHDVQPVINTGTLYQ